MKRLFNIVILIFLLHPSFAQLNVDSTYRIWMDSTINPSTRANALNSIFQQIKGNHPDSAFYLAKLHVDYSKNNGLDTLLFQAYINLGEASKILEKPKLSLDSYFQALRLASYFSDTLFLISAEANIAAAYTYFQQPE